MCLGPRGRRGNRCQKCQRARGATWAKTEEELAAEDGRRPLHCYGWGGSTSWVQGTHRRFTPRERMQRRFRGRRGDARRWHDSTRLRARRWPSVIGRVMNASTVTKTNRAYGLVRRSKPYYHTTGGEGKEEQQQEQEQEQEEGRRRNGPAELRLSKRGQSRQAKCSCRGARPGCRGNTGKGRGREGSAVRYANPRGLHRQVRSRI